MILWTYRNEDLALVLYRGELAGWGDAPLLELGAGGGPSVVEGVALLVELDVGVLEEEPVTFLSISTDKREVCSEITTARSSDVSLPDRKSVV